MCDIIKEKTIEQIKQDIKDKEASAKQLKSDLEDAEIRKEFGPKYYKYFTMDMEQVEEEYKTASDRSWALRNIRAYRKSLIKRARGIDCRCSGISLCSACDFHCG